MTEPPEIDASVPNSARIWNYWLGGKDNYPVDREAGDDYRAIYPEIVDVVDGNTSELLVHSERGSALYANALSQLVQPNFPMPNFPRRVSTPRDLHLLSSVRPTAGCVV